MNAPGTGPQERARGPIPTPRALEVTAALLCGALSLSMTVSSGIPAVWGTFTVLMNQNGGLSNMLLGAGYFAALFAPVILGWLVTRAWWSARGSSVAPTRWTLIASGVFALNFAAVSVGTALPTLALSRELFMVCAVSLLALGLSLVLRRASTRRRS